MKIFSYVIIFFLLFSTGTYAKCISDGREVPTGTERGGYKCCSDGIWRKSCK